MLGGVLEGLVRLVGLLARARRRDGGRHRVRRGAQGQLMGVQLGRDPVKVRALIGDPTGHAAMRRGLWVDFGFLTQLLARLPRPRDPARPPRRLGILARRACGAGGEQHGAPRHDGEHAHLRRPRPRPPRRRAHGEAAARSCAVPRSSSGRARRSPLRCSQPRSSTTDGSLWIAVALVRSCALGPRRAALETRCSASSCSRSQSPPVFSPCSSWAGPRRSCAGSDGGRRGGATS